MNFDEFKQEVKNNRPRMALVLLVPVLEDLIAQNESMAEELRLLKSGSQQSAPEIEEAEVVEKKAPAKKAASKRTAAPKKDDVIAESETPDEE